MHKKYAAKKDIGFGLLFLICPIVSWFMLFMHPTLFLFLFAVIITAFFLWVWFGTYYRLSEEYFIWHSGPLRKKIPIKKIVSVSKDVRSFYGMRPALTFRYLQIRYNIYDDVFIAPKDEEAFITDLTIANSGISISG